MDYTIRYRCGPVRRKFHGDITSRVKLLIGPFRSGKTAAAAWDLIEGASLRVLPTRGVTKTRFAVIRNTYPELASTTIRTYLDWFPPEIFGMNGASSYNQTAKTYQIRHPEDKREIEILFKALDQPQDVRDLLSLEITAAHVDECREVHQDVILFLLGRIGQFPYKKDCDWQEPFLSTPQLILTTNYPSREHYLYKWFCEEQREGYSIYRTPQEENIDNLPAGYYEQLEKDYLDRPDLLRTLVRGDWGITVQGKQVYPQFNEEVHVSKVSLKGFEGTVVRGWDNTGLYPACVITQISPLGCWNILHEFIGEDVSIIDFCDMVRQWCRQSLPDRCGYIDYADPAGKNRDSTQLSPSHYMKLQGINVRDGIQEFKIRKDCVAGRLEKRNGILIDPSCKKLIDGFAGGYAYGEIANSGIFRTEPQKNTYSHVHDALQYPATRLFLRHDKEEDEEEGDWRYAMLRQQGGRSAIGGY